MSYLLDTNVLSENRKPAGNPLVKAWIDTIPDDALYVSVLVLGEVRRGAELLRHRRDIAQAVAVEAWLTVVETTYSSRIVPITAEIADVWGRLNVPDPLPAVDGLLAATALVHDWTLVTRNTRDIARTGVRFLNPFAPISP